MLISWILSWDILYILTILWLKGIPSCAEFMDVIMELFYSNEAWPSKYVTRSSSPRAIRGPFVLHKLTSQMIDRHTEGGRERELDGVVCWDQRRISYSKK